MINHRNSVIISFVILIILWGIPFAFSNNLTGCPTQYAGTTVNPTAGGNLSQCSCVLDPVVVAGGEFFYPVTDVSIPGPGRQNGLALKFSRTYNSLDSAKGVLGTDWSSDLDISLVDLGGPTVSILDSTSNVITFQQQATGLYVDGEAKVVKAGTGASTTYTYTQEYGTQYFFNATGQIQYIQDKNGNRITYNYTGNQVTSISDQAGRSLTFTYNSNGSLNNLTDPLERVWAYSYNTNGDLASVKDPLGRVTTYQYNDPYNVNHITAITDPAGYTTSYQYNAQGQVTLETKPDNSTIQFPAYNNLLGTSTMIDEFGNTWMYEYHLIGLTTLVIDPLGGTWHYTYDPNTNLRTSATDPLGHVTTYTYDANQNLSVLTDALGHTTKYSYDPTFHEWLTLTDANGNTITRTLDANGDVLTQTDALGNKTVYTYDTSGDVLTITDPLGNTTSNIYDKYGNVTSKTDPLGKVISYTYDLVGRVLSVTDQDGNTTQYTYDAGNHVTQILFADGSKNTFTYDADDRVLTKTDGLNLTTKLTYGPPEGNPGGGCPLCSGQGQGLDLPITFTDPLGHATNFTYDAHGNILTTTDANGHTTQYQYDAYDRRTASIDPLGAKATYGYTGANAALPTLKKPTSITDPDGDTTTFAYDALSRPVQTTDALGKSTSVAYDPVGNLLGVTDANGNVTSYAYDADNRRISLTNPAGSKTSYSYDKDGDVVSKTDFMDQTITYSYDKDNRLIKKLYPDSTSVTLAYNGVGKVTSMVDATGTTDYSYDVRYRITKVIAPGVNNTINYTYDADSNRLSMTNQDKGKTSYVYDADNRLVSLTNPQAQVTKYVYDPVNNLLTQTGSNGTVTTNTYDKDNQLLTIITKGAKGDILASSVSVYDPAGLKTGITQDNGDVITYSYDADHHLTGETKDTGSKSLVYADTYTYDAVGNRLAMDAKLPATSSSEDYTYNDLNELTEAVPVAKSGKEGAATTYSYNADGDRTKMVASGQTTSYAYDFDNRLTKITYPNKETSVFVYSGDSRRLKTTEDGAVTNYLYDNHLPIVERNGSDVTKDTYTEGVGYPGGIGSLISRVNKDSTTLWYHYVHNGETNVGDLSNERGDLVEKYDYDAFGNIVAESGTRTNDRQFQTKEVDSSSGLVYFGRRWYDPTVGRWITPDPLGFVNGTNLYLYANNDPVNLSDAWGLQVVPEEPLDPDTFTPNPRYNDPNTGLPESIYQNIGFANAIGSLPGQINDYCSIDNYNQATQTQQKYNQSGYYSYMPNYYYSTPDYSNRNYNFSQYLGSQLSEGYPEYHGTISEWKFGN